jgi:DNA polymerase elongation subunit (family B)
LRPIVAIDCETDPFKYGRIPKPFIWGGYLEIDGVGQFRHFPNFGKLLEWLLSFDRKMVVYAHNSGRFDFMFKEVIEQIVSGSNLKIINGRLGKFRIGELEFRDSLLAVPVALGKYKKDKFNYRKLEANVRDRHKDEIIHYLESDCKNLWELISAFVNNYGAALTLAGASQKQAIQIENLEAPHSTAAYFRDLKPFYYGGRVQCFARGKVTGPIQSWDINSAYPDAMTKKHPFGARYHLRAYHGGKIDNASCLSIEAEAKGAFPFGEKKFGTTFPDDGERRLFKITGWEFNAAKRCGLLGKNWKILEVYDFPVQKSFGKYVKHFYKLRMESPEDSPERLFGKLFMNSFYGKQGQDPAQYEEYVIDEQDAELNRATQGFHKRNDTIDGRAIYARAEPKERHRYYDVACALSVTGCVRAKLMETKYRLEKMGSKVLYFDTDGAQTKGPGVLESSKELGAWKLEDVADVGYYGGKKLYARLLQKKYWKKDDNGKIVKWKKAHKGAILTPHQIVGLAEDGETIVYKKDAPSMGILSGIRFIKRNVRATHK